MGLSGVSSISRESQVMAIQPGSLVNLPKKPGRTYQVINVDDRCDCAWVRRWPLKAEHRPTFAVPLHDVIRTPQPPQAG
ncbi:MAG: hypothetical protein FJ078_02720 [Cyanobacteria bacterium K_DeepCast_35m_m2_155]|nr:hypothetical protein [Cyanobacteria bacterium K_DeepCast_35m_m2_155]